jgi:hypothetical protein
VHATHTLAPAVGITNPTAQAVQPPEPVDASKKPGAQSWQAEAPEPAYVPAPQTVHTVLPWLLLKPAAHAVHSVSASVSATKPSAQ